MPLSDRDFIDAYRLHGTLTAAGDALGVERNVVHRRLKKLGFKLRAPEFTDDQLAFIRAYYQTKTHDFDIAGLAAFLGKSKHNVCRAARHMGLTKPGRVTDKRLAAAKAAGNGQWSRRPHPRGMLGKVHTEETKRILGKKSKQRWVTDKAFGIGQMSEESRHKRSERMSLFQASRPAESNYTRTKGGHREDLNNQFFRSSWEANYARYLNLLQKMGVVDYWKFEPKTFWFEGIRRGTVSYRPDFEVKYKGDKTSRYVEIKGWERPKDRTKAARMARYYPDVLLEKVGAKQYYNLQNKWASAIPNWEWPSQKRV